jgi:serine/threonine protein kinase
MDSYLSRYFLFRSATTYRGREGQTHSCPSEYILGLGLSLKDLALGKNKKKLSELVNNKETFFKELETNITKMHQDNIHHRDLHSGNVMYDFKTKQPVIIDFGHATKAWSSDEDKDIYIGDGYIKDEVTKRSVFKKIIFSKDMDKLKELKKDF